MPGSSLGLQDISKISRILVGTFHVQVKDGKRSKRIGLDEGEKLEVYGICMICRIIFVTHLDLTSSHLLDA